MKEQREYDDYLKQLGQNLRDNRKKKGLTMEDLAHEAEIEYRQLGRIERGEVNTSVISLLRLCEALKIEMKDLFDN